ncbi:recombinase family protein [Siphonobacter sp. SORGH_AS_0500]|uniref:recombinase family protein n=1 Tax=Siphonobacter sp. SORGH_AS_0500 TaxID=1864824 RepID=UPI0038F7940D
MYQQFISYYRISTIKKGRSVLEFEAQKQAVEKFTYSKEEVLTSFTDIEYGKKNERLQLQAAIAYCNISSTRCETGSTHLE